MGGNETQIDSTQPELLATCKQTLEVLEDEYGSRETNFMLAKQVQAAIAAEEKRLAAPPDHAARLREAAPEMWQLVREVAACKSRSWTGRSPIVNIRMPRSLLNRFDAAFDELQPTENER